MLWVVADGGTLLAVAGLSAIATLILFLQWPWLLSLVLVGLAALLSGLWQGYGAAVYGLVEPVVLVSLVGGWLAGYRRWGGRWGLLTLVAIVGLGYGSMGDTASWLPLLWGAGLGAMVLPAMGPLAIAIATLSDQGLYAVLSHSTFGLAATKLMALLVFGGISEWRRRRSAVTLR